MHKSCLRLPGSTSHSIHKSVSSSKAVLSAVAVFHQNYITSVKNTLRFLKQRAGLEPDFFISLIKPVCLTLVM